jgi:hypothetical protein
VVRQRARSVHPDDHHSALDPPAATKEMERCAAKGAKAVTMTEMPTPMGLPSFWTDCKCPNQY